MIKQDAKYKEGNKTIISACVNAPFDEAKAEFEANGYKIISLPQFARLRIEQGKDSHVADYGSYTKEGFLYIPQKGIFLVRNSPILANAKEATECHRNGKEFYLTAEQVEKSLTDSVKVKVKYGKTILTKRFGENDLTAFAFGAEAEKYGEFLQDAGIKEMPVYLAYVEQKPFARQAWLRRLVDVDRSALFDDDRNLDYGDAVRGVRLTSTEGAKSAKNLYSPEAFFKACTKAGIVIQGNLEKKIRGHLR